MPGGSTNPISLTGFVEKVSDTVHKAKTHMHENAHDLAQVTKQKEEDKLNGPCVDVIITFISASGIPKLDVVGASDPYFVAKLDDRVSMVSTVKTKSLAPEWNELWRVKNVPTTSELRVEILDKDTDTPHDDYIGKFKTTIEPGEKEIDIQGPLFRKDRGTFKLKIETAPSNDPAEPKYLFDGPIRYSRHFSPLVGKLTDLDDARLYSTWKIYLIDVPVYFKDVYQHWNVKYKAAQSIFGSGPTSLAIRAGIHAGHKMLYARSTSNGFGVIQSVDDVMRLFEGGKATGGCGAESPFARRIKPAVYTYIISAQDDSLRFSETGAAFFVDFASKHALHADCAEQVRYSGEFHLRPRDKDHSSWCGWQDFNDSMPDDSVDWEVVIDNNSGTYAPDKAMLPTLRDLIDCNFPGLDVVALDRENDELKKSVDACQEYALKYRGVKSEHLQPHQQEGHRSLLKPLGAVVGKVAHLQRGNKEEA
ncbi:hypothetical protein EV368DRAFT_74935 [Lentinula lateritia]|uniref:Uncharacterized protein n=1 Tax=Lentinula aff. lateritia TaxID=2804960 RepID=A0ACC1U4R3_9AGAR|nr:hypothetical protein F5876DRAFT_87929 [Lentinula aff. lateritia]KAJ3850804.1 hypothetical protein EV368DRAFT_74935 [Lentinula lateritia]